MKSYTDSRKSQNTEQNNKLPKFVLDTKERKLQSRQQQILSIVKNIPSDSIKKLNIIASKPITSNENSNSSILNHKIKTPSKLKIVQKESPKPKTNEINNVFQKNGIISRETINWMDKHYLHSSLTKSMKYSKNTKTINNQIKNNEVLNEKKVDDTEHESTAIENNLSESEKIVEDLGDEVVNVDELIEPKTVNIKDVIRQKVQKAIKEGKIFLIRADIPYLDTLLNKRGWIKKYESTKTRHLAYGNFSLNLELTSSLGDIHDSDMKLNENAFIYQELKQVPPNFIWDCRNDFVHWKGNIRPDTYLNRLEQSSVYTSKLGLACFLEKFYWNFEENVSDILFPRSYNISDEKEAFIEDYRKTATVSFIRWFIDQVEQNSNFLNRNFSHLLIKPLKFAIEKCEEIISIVYNGNLNNNLKQISSKDWDWFIEVYIKCIHKEDNKETDKLKNEENWENPEIMKLYDKAINITEKIQDFDLQYDLNGIRNIWILKPNMSCCGYGITMTHKLSYILVKVEDSAKNYFLVQKYIEKPLLVKNTKFDVRHWFLVTNNYPLTIWIYKESLLRFSSRPFTFDNYHEIIHICNTAVQRKYTDQKNPVRNLNWDCDMLNLYLKETYPNYIGEPWYDNIYPKMCQAIVAAMLSAQDRIDSRDKSFELYGADFVIMEDLSVWLIEINTNPRMHPPSSKITERLYPEVLESLIKVILDYPDDKEADTGNFVLVYQQKVDPSFKLDQNLELSVQGRMITKNQILIMDSELDQMQTDQ